jgi:hypothetical protein
VAGALFYCPKAGLQRGVVRVEGILDGLMYIGGPNHLLYLMQLEYKAIYRPVRIGTITIDPSPAMKILGLQLDSELKWNTQVQVVKKRMGTQMHALTRTTASTWGATMIKAR